MTKARDLANLISTGNPLSDGAIAVSEISDLTASAAELNKLQGVTASTAELNQVVGATSALQTQLDNISVTSGSLTKTFTQNETADITLSQGITSAPVVSATKEVPQTGISSKGNWDVNSSASNYDFHNTAANVTLTPSTVANTSISLTQVGSDLDINTYGPKPSPFFKSDGTKMYICSQSSAYIYQYSLSTAWDLSTATWDGYSHSFSTNAATSEADPTDLFFKPDGTVLFVVGLYQDEIRAYDLSTAWDLSTASLSSSNLMSTAGESAPRGFRFKSDGSVVYVVGGNANALQQYTLSTAWDLSTKSSPTAYSFTASQDNGPHGIEFNSTGTRMYVLGGSSGNGKLFQYNLSTAWDLSTASYANVFHDFSSSNSGTSPHGIFIDSSETRVYFACGGVGAGRIYQFSNGQAALALGSGSFASTDVGKRITGNGGDVILTATSGTFDTTGGSAFTDSSTIASGSWQMFGVQPTASGISINRKIDGAYNVSSSTISPSSVLSTVSGKFSATAPYGGAFVHPDGTMLFVNEEYNIRRYDMSTPHDLSTLSTAVYTYYIGTSNNTGLTFRPDGLRMYTVDQSYLRVKSYVLTTAWDPTSATSSTIVTPFSAVGTDAYLQNIKFNPDGTKMYGLYYQGNNQIQSYDLSTPYDVTTGSNMKQNGGGVGFANYNNLRDFAFVNNGSAALATRDGSNQIYYCEMTTPYDISTFVNNTLDQWQGGTGSGAASYITAIAEQDGKFYGINSTNNEHVWNWSIKDAYSLPDDYFVSVTNSGGQIDTQYWTDINSMTADQTANAGTVNYAVSTDGRTTWSVAKSTDGVRPIVRNNSGTWQYNNNGGTSVATGFLLSAASYDNKSMSFSSQSTGGSEGGSFNGDGTKLYLGISGYIYQYNLTTAYDLSTASYANVSYNFTGTTTNTGQLIVKSDNTKLWWVNRTNKYVYEFTFGTADDLSTLSQTTSYNASGTATSATGLEFNSTGTKMYVGGYSNSTVYQFSLSTAWDVSTASYDSVSKTFPEGNGFHNIRFNSDGTKFFFLHANNDTVYEYSLSTAFDISTAASSASNSFSVSSQESSGPCMLDFSSDGTKMVIGGYGNDAIYQYSTSSTSISYATTATWVNGTTNDELYTLQEALTAQAFNRMDKTQLDAVADANHFPTGSSLDLMIALQMTNDSGVRPVSDGVTINFDAASLNEGAVLGTDYDYFFPANNKVQIKSLAAQNLKVRIV